MPAHLSAALCWYMMALTAAANSMQIRQETFEPKRQQAKWLQHGGVRMLTILIDEDTSHSVVQTATLRAN